MKIINITEASIDNLIHKVKEGVNILLNEGITKDDIIIALPNYIAKGMINHPRYADIYRYGKLAGYVVIPHYKDEAVVFMIDNVIYSNYTVTTIPLSHE